MHMTRRLTIGTLAGVTVAVGLIAWGLNLSEPAEKAGSDATRVASPAGEEQAPQGSDRPKPSYGFAGEWSTEENPMGIGEEVSAEEAEDQTPYALPVPVTNAATGDLVATWLAPGGRVAFVWDTKLVMFVEEDSISEAENAAAWTQKVAEQPGEPWVLTEVDGHPAIGMDRDAEVAPELSDGKGEEVRILGSSLTIAFGNLLVQFNSPDHSLSQLRSFAEQLGTEE